MFAWRERRTEWWVKDLRSTIGAFTFFPSLLKILKSRVSYCVVFQAFRSSFRWWKFFERLLELLHDSVGDCTPCKNNRRFHSVSPLILLESRKVIGTQRTSGKRKWWWGGDILSEKPFKKVFTTAKQPSPIKLFPFRAALTTFNTPAVKAFRPKPAKAGL